MTKSLHILWLVCVLFAQSLSLSHATEFGEQPHEHDGIECVIQTLVHEGDDTAPPPPSIEDIWVGALSFERIHTFRTARIKSAAETLPPPRAPPF